jgi:hypothetical protein
VKDAVQTGGVKIHDPGGGNVMSILLESALESAERLYLHSSWGLMRAGEGEFVMPDRAQAVFDPHRPFPWVMDAPFSSLKSQTTTPISSESCLIVVPAPDRARFRVKTITGKEVDEVNLRSFGWAGRSIFGSSTEHKKDLRNGKGGTGSHQGATALSQCDPDRAGLRRRTSR